MCEPVWRLLSQTRNSMMPLLVNVLPTCAEARCHWQTVLTTEFGGRAMGRIFKYPELLFVALVVLAPVVTTLLWRSSAAGFLLRLLSGLAAGLAIWLFIILLIVRPK